MDPRTGDAGGRTRRAHASFERLLHGGLIALLIASTMNGLTLEWRVFGSELTVRPDQLVLVCLMPLVFLAFGLGPFRVRVTLFEWIVLGFICSNVAASILFSASRGASLKGAVLLGAYAAMYFVVRQVLTNRAEWLRGATTWTLVLGVAQAVYCLIALAFYSLGHSIGGLQIGHLRAGSVAIKGTFWEPNLLGAYLGLIALFLAVRYALRAGRGRDATDLPGLFITSLALPLTITRAAGIALVMGLLALAAVVWICRQEILDWRARATKLALTFATVVLLTVTVMDDFMSGLSRYPDFLIERWTSISSAVGEDPSTPNVSAAAGRDSGLTRGSSSGDVTRLSRSSVDGRFQAWSKALEYWRERPVLGHGTLAGKAYVKDGWWYSSVVQALYDTGLVGFVLLLAIYIGAVALPVWIWFRSRRAASPDLLGFGVGNALLALSSQFSSFLFVGFPWVFMGLSIAAVQVALTRSRGAKDRTAPATLSAARVQRAARDERIG